MKAILTQLPIPRINFGLNTGNIPLAGACLKQAAQDIPGWEVTVLSEESVSWTGDLALIQTIVSEKPDLVGFTIYAWNMDRSIFIAGKIKEQTGARIVFGGPQVTEDTREEFPEDIDFLVAGEGEAAFRGLLLDKNIWETPQAKISGSGHPPQSPCKEAFSPLAQGSPYVNGHLPLGPGNVMLLETQRGCPYKCGFCYYSKAKKQRDTADNKTVLEGITWALENQVKEIYLMDPSLNARPGLKDLMDEIARRNTGSQIPIISEIRAESITPQMAQRYAKAGVTQFEVGLQSTNPEALDIMNRPTRLPKFIKGVKALQDAGIAPTIDLIFGLPGDSPQGFENSVNFILDQGFEDHIQTFPLLVLPGTDFRKRSQVLGLEYAPHPPYPVIQTDTFSPDDMEAALDYSEQAFDRAFMPFPDLDTSFESFMGKDYWVEIQGRKLVSKLVLDGPRPLAEIAEIAETITSPFQIFFSGKALNPDYMPQVISAISRPNPFVPLEIIFIHPEYLPDTETLLEAAAHERPHFLDLDQHYLYPEPGNRSILFTLVTQATEPEFCIPMHRQVHFWQKGSLPGMDALQDMAGLDGILISGNGRAVRNWQGQMAQIHEEILPVTFTDIGMQNRWMKLTDNGKYHLAALDGRESFFL